MTEPSEITHATDESAAKPPRSTSLSMRTSSRNSEEFGTPHSDKFRMATATLVSVAIVSLIIAVAVLAHHSSNTSSARWSTWSPGDDGSAGATDIAEHVAPLYRVTAADQLDLVTLVNLINPNASGTTSGSGLEVAVNTATSGSSSTSTTSLSLLSGKTIAYNLCGLGGSNCALGGTPSASRLLLLRREALELALYTFKYINGSENVVCILPPGRTETPSTLSPKLPSAHSSAQGATAPLTVAVLFVRSELQPWLNQPLSSTLQTYPPPTSELKEWRLTEEAGLVDQITARGLFSEKIESAQDGTNLMVLNALPPS